MTEKGLRSTQNSVKARFVIIEEEIARQGSLKFSQVKFDLLRNQLDNNWKVFEETNQKLHNYCTDQAATDAQLQENRDLSARYLKMAEELEILKPDATPTASTAKVKLPDLVVPVFHGELEKWTSFYDLFSASIHSQSGLRPSQKLQYLKSSLKGEAESIISHLSITDSNYAEAWQLLKDRFDNKREIVEAHLTRLLIQPSMKEESGPALRKLVDVTRECIQALQVLKVPTDHWDVMLVHLLKEKLDPETRRQWVLSLSSSNLPTFKEFCDFLSQRSRAVTESTAKLPATRNVSTSQKQKNVSSHHGTADPKCKICKDQSHLLFKCQTFRNWTVKERQDHVKEKKLCFNCFSPSHRSQACANKTNCKKCNKRHHTMIHSEVTSSDSTPDEAQSTSHHVAKAELPSQVLLQTAVVNVPDSRGNFHAVRALLDSASECSFVTEKITKQLGLKTRRTNVTVKGVSSVPVGASQSLAHVPISSRIYPFKTHVEALVMPKITGKLPSSVCQIKDLEHLGGIKLADPFYSRPEEIDLLIGADIYTSLLRPSTIIRGPQGSPDALDTMLGWVVSGPVTSPSSIVTSLHTRTSLQDIVQRFWELETIPEEDNSNDQPHPAEQHFLETHQRMPDGRYMLKLPLKTNSPKLGLSRDTAVRRLLQMERKFEKNREFQRQYVAAIQECQISGYMKRVPPGDVIEGPHVYYMPHHGVLKASSTTTKLRVVYDASAKTTSGVSLNDRLHVGPKTQEDLLSHLLRFRMWKIAISADIKHMYHQFLVHPEDQSLQRIVWRETSTQPIQDWQMTVVTFGNCASPFLATRALCQLAEDEKASLPQASQVMLRDVYVDNVMTGGDDIVAVTTLQNQLLELCQRGKIELRKWISNDPSILERLDPELRETKLPLHMNPDDSFSTLGLQWNPASDTFSFVASMPINSKFNTKRSLLSEVSKIFDPMGWLSPVTIKMKILFQRLWQENMGWDDQLPSEVLSTWSHIHHQLKSIEQVKIPRLARLPHSTNLQLLGFCDASEKAYAAAVYLRSSLEDRTQVILLIAKTRVAPTKKETLPRLELCGALLLTRLMDTVRRHLRLEEITITLWTDSTIVLSWIEDPYKWKTFVSNRISQIVKSYPRPMWHHVRSQENPADSASRGIDPSELQNHLLWWHGPTWCQEPCFNFPTECKIDKSPEIPELRNVKSFIVQVDSSILERYQSLSRLLRVVAACLRVVPSRRVPCPTQEFSVAELDTALNKCITLTQRSAFAKEIALCEENLPLSRKSNLLPLSPFLDRNGLLRVGGRLRHSSLPEDKKHPILLPTNGKLTHLIIKQEHFRGQHAGPTLLLSMIRQRFWIIRGQLPVKRFVQRCVICFRQRAASLTQKMGDLPPQRVNQARAFLKSGVDYAGPIQIRRSLGPRNTQLVKSYICIFVCLTTHAIHLEPVSDLTTDAFVAALKRFVSRRGLCSDMFSDCGSNFVGADKELARDLEFLRAADNVQRVTRSLSSVGVTWHFNPPSSPHFGGLWESGVGVVKGHLKRVTGTTTLNFEELATVLAQVEACVNSRPLTPLSSDPEELSALTPGHFLIGGPLNAIPEPDLSEINISRLSRWQRCQQLAQEFWKRWHDDYLCTLQKRTKWSSTSANVKEGTLVLLKDERLPPMKWKLGRITATHPGKDELVRVVSVKTADGEFKRPIVKICPLPVDDAID